MATPLPPQAEPQEPPLPPRIPVIHNAAIAGAIISPLVMLMPPRRMDIRFFILAGAFSLSTNQLAYEYTGSSIYSRFNTRASSVFGGVFSSHLPEGAQRTQQLLREQREREAAHKAAGGKGVDEDKPSGIAALGKNIWMGAEQEEGWQQRRDEEHRKKLEEGKGLAGIIMDQVSDVLSGNWKDDAAGKDKKDDDRPEKK